MEFLDLTLPTPEENLALDEAILDEAAAGADIETLRLWEPRQTMVVLGRSSVIEAELCVEACRRQGVPVLRRASGGAAIVTGPGCLMYSLVLSHRRRHDLRSISQTHRFVLDTLVAALQRWIPQVQREGTSDLAIAGRKFSGNSMRWKREHVLYHGTLLYAFALEQVGRLLRDPPREPTYRAGRGHREFLTNLPLPVDVIRASLREAWGDQRQRTSWPRVETARLAAEKRIGPTPP